MEDLFPEEYLLADYGGRFDDYMEAVYYQFRLDFIESKPSMLGKRFGLKSHPMQFGKEATFYHMTHSGSVEEEREPDLGRMEKIAYIRCIIDNWEHPDVRAWKNKRGRNTRILLFCEKVSMLVILDEREHYILPWTAYCIDRNHKVRKLIKEYDKYIRENGRLST